MKAKTCKKCGGNRRVRDGGCNLCEMFAASAVRTTGKAGWPMRSLALAVHPSQAAEATERNRRAGVNVTYDRLGRAVIPDAATRKKLMRLEGVFDRDSFI